MMGAIFRRAWFWGPVILWMAVIFMLSAIPGDDLPDTGVPNIDKLFHFVEYLVLGAFLVRAFLNSDSGMNLTKIVFISIIIAALYGLTDEFHQRYISGRTPDIIDLAFDLIGSSVGSFLYSKKG